jgi:hypothetical protein
MPRNIQIATPTTVLPQSLCRAWAHERAYPLIENQYRIGESQRTVQAANSRKRWRLAKRLTPVLAARRGGSAAEAERHCRGKTGTGSTVHAALV